MRNRLASAQHSACRPVSLAGLGAVVDQRDPPPVAGAPRFDVPRAAPGVVNTSKTPRPAGPARHPCIKDLTIRSRLPEPIPQNSYEGPPTTPPRCDLKQSNTRDTGARCRISPRITVSVPPAGQTRAHPQLGAAASWSDRGSAIDQRPIDQRRTVAVMVYRAVIVFRRSTSTGHCRIVLQQGSCALGFRRRRSSYGLVVEQHQSYRSECR